MIAVPVERVREIQEMNRKGKKPAKLVDNVYDNVEAMSFGDVVGNDSITRFEKKGDARVKKHKRGKRRNKNGKRS
jgi:hypothetical protein